MKRNSKRKDEATAYHEAGHAVTNFELGRRMRKVTVIPTEGYLGACFDHKLLDSMADTYGDTPAVRKRVEREIMGKFAGKLAEDRFRGKNSKRPSRIDFNSASAVAASMVSKEEQEPYLNWLYVRTKILINRPETWRAIVALAEELIRKKTLTGKEAYKIWEDIYKKESEVAAKEVQQIIDRMH